MEKKISPSTSFTNSQPLKKFASISKKPNSFWLHSKVLIWKQFLVFSRNFKSTLFQIGTPVFICLFLLSLQQFATYAFTSTIDKNPDDISVSKVPMCYGSGCITIGIGYTNNKHTELSEFVINHLAETQDFKIGKDIQVVANSYTDLIDYLKANTNKTQTVVLFCTGEFEIPESYGIGGTFDCLRETPGYNLAIYSLLINSTITGLTLFTGFNEPRPVDYASLAVKAAVDSAIYEFYKGNEDSNQIFDVKVEHFPSPTNRFLEGYDIVTDVGVFYFFIPPMVTFVVILIEIVREKEYRLRHGLSMMGMSSGPYWFSWFVTGFAFTFLVTNSLIVSSLACGFGIFLYTPYPIILCLFTVFSLAMINLAFLLSTLIKTTKSAYTTSYAFILIGLVLQFLLSNVTLIYLLYADNLPMWAKVSRVLLSLYPPFNFSKAFGDISTISGAHYDSDEGRWVRGNDYPWSEFTKTISVDMLGTQVNVPSTADSILIIIGNGLMIALIAWYLDHVISHNRGTPDPFYFFLSPYYWGLKKKRRLNEEDESLSDAGLDNEKGPCPSVMSEVDFTDGVSIRGLGKRFKQQRCCGPASEIHAVNDLSMDINSRELLAILGHNGAGKSTLINILTGLTKASYGSATICGYDIHTEMDKIRKVLGVCPQHDILWDELSAKEHLILFGRIKQLPYDVVIKDAEEKLKQVKLDHVKDRHVGTFSGGMKRRLSVAISGVGNPKIIILDEPTTGMDPINRRNAWKLIQQMKEGRVVLLTTHSMEEADVLSDRVCVIVNGELKCLGTALSLKNNYGDGYRITTITENPEKLTEVLKDEFPAAKIIDSSGGSLVISIPLDRVDQIELFFRTMEGLEEGSVRRVKKLIKDWGLSNTTLEEVFMRVTGKKEKV